MQGLLVSSVVGREYGGTDRRDSRSPGVHTRGARSRAPCAGPNCGHRVARWACR
jgi:hypothetical protein